MECLHDNLEIITENLKRNWYVLHLYIAKLLSVPYKYHSLCKFLRYMLINAYLFTYEIYSFIKIT